MASKESEPRVIVALDFPSEFEAMNFVDSVHPDACRLKVGHELFTSAGPRIVEALQKRNFDVFLDLKFHDIPNTAAGACSAAAHLGCWMINIHAAGGSSMITAARAALDVFPEPPLLVAVTVLTSLGAPALAEIGFNASPEHTAINLATLAYDAGADGVVCSVAETAAMRERFGSAFCLVTPGIRPSGSQAQDQSRIATPRAAIENGASYIVVGRPITQAQDPPAALASINDELSNAG